MTGTVFAQSEEIQPEIDEPPAPAPPGPIEDPVPAPDAPPSEPPPGPGPDDVEPPIEDPRVPGQPRRKEAD